MCLKVRKEYKIETARENITCYKVLEVWTEPDDDTLYYQTPYRCVPVKFLQDGTATLEALPDNEAYEDEVRKHTTNSLFSIHHSMIGYGVIHSYIDYELAEEKNSALNDPLLSMGTYIIRKCIIPKGTKYIMSHNGKEVGSQKLIIYNE